MGGDILTSLFTIGYSPFNIDDFIAVLKHYGINVVIDVRSRPYSEYHACYNKEHIEYALGHHNIYYRSYSREFGAQQTDVRFLSLEGYLDFELFAASPAFQEGFSNIINSIAQGYTLTFMCAEKDPAVCHRAIMVSRAFYEKGYEVKHILSDGQTEGQSDIEYRLLDKYFPYRNQLTLFGNDNQDSLIASAYKKRNAEIGYRSEGVRL